MQTPLKPVTVPFAPNGPKKTKKDHPGLPMTAKELGETAAACHDAGAAMIHLHVRDHDGVHLLDEHAYRTATTAVARAVGRDMGVTNTWGAGGRYPRQEQMAVARGGPLGARPPPRGSAPSSRARDRTDGAPYAWLPRE